AAHFGRVSVVMIARVNALNALAEARRARASPGSAPRMRSTGSGTPITPVEQTSTCCGRQPSSRAAAVAVRRAAALPADPVAQLAFPELTTIARRSPAEARKCALERTTGAACTRFVVNPPAPAAARSVEMSARSSRFFFLRPQAVAANRKPWGSTLRDTRPE